MHYSARIKLQWQTQKQTLQSSSSSKSTKLTDCKRNIISKYQQKLVPPPHKWTVIIPNRTAITGGENKHTTLKHEITNIGQNKAINH